MFLGVVREAGDERDPFVRTGCGGLSTGAYVPSEVSIQARLRTVPVKLTHGHRRGGNAIP